MKFIFTMKEEQLSLYSIFLSMPICFFIECDIFKIKNTLKIKSWLKFVFRNYGIKKATINYIFCTDASLLEINLKYLSHDTLTDIITFDLKENETLQSQIISDIYISLERVLENAMTNQCSNAEELLRVMSHGVLHLLGYKDKTKKHAEIMRREEEKCIAIYCEIHNVPRGTL